MSALDAASPAAAPQQPPPSLAQLLADDDVHGVLARLRQDGIVNDPDARLRLLTGVLAHIAAAPQSGEPQSASHPEPHGSRWRWADVVMRGVTDPWSRIRSLSTPVMADLLQAEVDLILQRRHGPQQQQRGGNSYSNSSTAASSLSCDGGCDSARAAAAPTCEGVSEPLAYMWERWRAAALWYEQDGIVRALAKLYNRSGTRAGDALRTDEVGLRNLLTYVIFPALRNAQLPVRESAALTIGLLADSRRPSTLPPRIVSLVVSHVAQTLAETPAPLRRHAPASSVAVENTRALEGNLLALNELVEAGVVPVESCEMMPLLLRLSSYPASSVRQYVAQILRPPSVSVFAYLMQRLCEHHDCMPQRADGDGVCSSSESDSAAGSRDADGEAQELSWQRLETVMMALHQHLLYMHTSAATMHDLFSAASDTKAILTPAIFTTSLSVMFKATHSPCFEVARMGKQLFPLHLQMSLRFAPPDALPYICEQCCGPTGSVQEELCRLAESGDTARLAAARRYVGVFVVAAMWWFLTLRRIAVEVAGSKAASPTTGAPVETRALVEEMVLPYATLERVRAATEVQNVASEDGDGAATAAAAAPLPPCPTALCGLLPLAAYFAAAMDPHEWHRCVSELLVPSRWAAILADSEQRELARFGPDFVRAVHHRGTAAEMHRLVGLIPTLVSAARTAQPHLQCLLVAMLRVAVVAHTAGSTAAEERALSFVYHGAYTAPALVEGGDAVPLGHVWLKCWVPTQEAIPTAVLWGEQPAEPLRESVILVEDNSDVFDAIEKTCYRELYRSPQTEPVVLRELRALMISLSRPGIGTPSGKHVDWYAAALAAVFRRLEKVCPEWQETVAAAAGAAGETSGACGGGGGGDEDEEGGAECWDDNGDCWDDDDDDANGAAQGIYAAEEVRNAVAVVWALRERVTAWMDAADVRAAEEPFRSALDFLAASYAFGRASSGGSS